MTRRSVPPAGSSPALPFLPIPPPPARLPVRLPVRLPALLVVLALALATGCGGSDSTEPAGQSSSSDTPEAGSPGTSQAATPAGSTGSTELSDGSGGEDREEAGPTPTTIIDPWAAIGQEDDGTRLAVVVDHGGCGEGICRRVLDLSIDGTWRLIDQNGDVVADGAYDAAALAELASGPVDGLRLGPFEGECPTATDGSERSYRVQRPGSPGTVTVDLSTCVDRIDTAAPLIVALDLLMADADRQGSETRERRGRPALPGRVAVITDQRR